MGQFNCDMTISHKEQIWTECWELETRDKNNEDDSNNIFVRNEKTRPNF
jgi:hypothetical protein